MKLIGTLALAIALAVATQGCTTSSQESGPQQTVAASETPKIVIYHAEGRRSERIVWLCEELGVPYELVAHTRNAVTRLSPPALRA